MLADISQFFNRDGSKSPKLLGPCRLRMVSIDCGEDDEAAYILYEGDPQAYDSGKMLSLVYARNEVEPDAVENRILNCKQHQEKHRAIYNAVDEVIPCISFFYPTVTRIMLKTVDGSLTTAITEEIVAYLPIPPHLSHISTVPITELRKLCDLDINVDQVKWNGQTFAFKKAGDHLGGTLRELTILDKLHNLPNIIDLKAIVVNHDNSICGFLMPYMHTGNLQDVFVKVRRDLGLSEDEDELVFDWSLKLTWARQITQGVVDLHGIAAYNGDLKPRNIVLGPVGQAILIDFRPMGFSEEFAAPEVLAEQDHHDTIKSLLNGPADVFSLSLILYAVAQENANSVRVPSWRDGSVPCWYRDVVQSCLDLNPAARPSAVELLSIFQKNVF